jgi:hypothetical protein
LKRTKQTTKVPQYLDIVILPERINVSYMNCEKEEDKFIKKMDEYGIKIKAVYQSPCG